MRITTQMLNETARKTGVPINNTSLLNHINGGSDGDLLKVLNKGKPVRRIQSRRAIMRNWKKRPTG